MAKPIAAPLPTTQGIYWLRFASIPYDQAYNPPFSWDLPWEPGPWTLAEVDPTPTEDDGSPKEYFIDCFLGSDEIAKWDDGREIVVEVGPKVEHPPYPGT